MKKILNNSITYIVILSLGFTFLFTACEKSEEPMALPPAESLVIDWDMFPQQNTKSLAPEFALNWFYSFTTVLVWNATLAANIAIPTLAYTAAFNYTPVYLGDFSWQWSYSVPVNGRTYSARLVGTKIDRATFSMEMFLSEDGGFQDFNWFNGVIRYDRTEAHWTLSQSPTKDVEYLDILYQKDFDTDIANIRYSVIDQDSKLFGGYIDYGIDSTLDFDAHYTISRNDTTTNIEWSTNTKAGHVMDTRYFNDEAWHCWDTQLQDIDCAN